jgi:hypothetical protein
MKHFEFWHPRLFEIPYYLYLLVASSVRGLSIKSLAKANYALDHGEISIGSKYKTQHAFDQQSGFNFGPLDLKAQSESAFLRGRFVVIEVNGVALLLTNMFDPDL